MPSRSPGFDSQLSGAKLPADANSFVFFDVFWNGEEAGVESVCIYLFYFCLDISTTVVKRVFFVGFKQAVISWPLVDTPRLKHHYAEALMLD